ECVQSPVDHPRSRIDRVIGDALDIVAALGQGGRRFHLAGHDWGGSLAWQIADQSPARLASLTMLSRPHPQAFNNAANSSRRRTGSRSCPASDITLPIRTPI